MKKYLLILFLLGLFFTSHAQDLRGGDYRFIVVDSPLTFDVEVTLYFDTTQEPGLDTIRVWAEDLPRVAPLVEVIPLNRGIEAYLYRTTLFLSGGGQHSIFIDPTLPLVAENVVSDSLYWPLYCELDINYFTRPPFDTTHAVWELFEFDYSINQDGELRLKMTGYDPDGDGTVYYGESAWLNFLYGHGDIELLAPPDNFSLDPYSGDFIWQNPSGPGRYLLGFDLLGVTNEPFVINNRFSRYLILELTEEDFTISTNTNDAVVPEVVISPNPATHSIQVTYESLNGRGNLAVNNLQGQAIYRAAFPPTSTTTEIDVSTWPAGIYFLTLESEQGRIVRKLVVKR